jgi:hypothetical protein
VSWYRTLTLKHKGSVMVLLCGARWCVGRWQCHLVPAMDWHCQIKCPQRACHSSKVLGWCRQTPSSACFLSFLWWWILVWVHHGRFAYISAGYTHIGYPIMVRMDFRRGPGFARWALDVKKMAFWGIFHKLGHNMQTCSTSSGLGMALLRSLITVWDSSHSTPWSTLSIRKCLLLLCK